MSNPLPLILLSSLVAGGVGAAVTTVLTSQPAADAAAPEVVGGGTEVLAALARMEDSYDALAERIDDLEASSELAPIITTSPRVAAAAPAEELEEVVKSVLATMDDAEVAGATPNLQRTVEAVIEMREEREKLERDQKRAAAEVQRMEDRLAKLQTDLGLDQNQVDSMRKIYQDQTARRDEMRTEMMALRDSGGSREDMRALWTGARDATNAAIQGVLSPTQYEQYQASERDNGRFGRGGGNDGNGRGGRGGRGGN